MTPQGSSGLAADLVQELGEVVACAIQRESADLREQVEALRTSLLSEMRIFFKGLDQGNRISAQDIVIRLEQIEERLDSKVHQPYDFAKRLDRADEVDVRRDLSMPNALSDTRKPPETPAATARRDQAQQAVKNLAFDTGALQAMGLSPATPYKDLASRGGLELMVVVLIMLNTVFNGVQLELETEASLAGDRKPRWLRLVDIGFTVAFTFEIVLRLLHERRLFFKGSHRWWNLFDGVILAADIVSKSFGRRSLMLARFLRLPRLVRCLGVLRLVNSVNTLRVFWKAFKTCIPFMFWATLIQFLLYYVGALAIGDFVIATLRRGPDRGAEAYGKMLEHHGSIFRSMTTLYMAQVGSLQWVDLAAPWSHYGAAGRFGLSIWLALSRFWFLAGVISAAMAFLATSATKLQRTEQTLRYWAERSPINAFKILLNATSKKQNVISRKELEEVLTQRHINVDKTLKKLELDADAVRGIFRLLAVGNHEDVHIDEIIISMSRSREPVDVMTMMYENRRVCARILALADSVQTGLCEIRGDMEAHEAKVSAAMRHQSDNMAPMQSSMPRRGSEEL